jgi:hypothetical protein
MALQNSSSFGVQFSPLPDIAHDKFSFVARFQPKLQAHWMKSIWNFPQGQRE